MKEELKNLWKELVILLKIDMMIIWTLICHIFDGVKLSIKLLILAFGIVFKKDDLEEDIPEDVETF